MIPGSGRSAPSVLAIVIATMITIPFAQSLFRVPIQVSDSLEAIVIATKYHSTSQMLEDSLRFSVTTFRPLRYLQTRWLLQTTEATGFTYNGVFRTAHVALLVLLVVLFLIVVQVRDWIDLVAFSVAFPVLVGIHTFATMLFEAFPVNHFAEVGVCALAVFALAQRQPRWFVPVVASLLLALALSVIESGAMVWVTIVCCAAAGMRGVTRSTVIATTVLFVAYLGLRHALGISSPGIGGHGSGFGDQFYSPEELAQRFGAHPLGFMIYNVAGGLASLLFAEPRQGVYSLLAAWHAREIHPIVIINIVSSGATSALLVWYAVARAGVHRATWTDTDRTFAAACAAIVVNALFNAVYMKDEIMSVGGLLFAVAAFVAVRALIQSSPGMGVRQAAFAAVLLAALSTLWAFRAVGVHYQLRYDAFKTRNDWVDVLRADKRADWPSDPGELAVTRRIRDEALDRRTASPSFMPRWGDRYWVE